MSESILANFSFLLFCKPAQHKTDLDNNNHHQLLHYNHIGNTLRSVAYFRFLIFFLVVPRLFLLRDNILCAAGRCAEDFLQVVQSLSLDHKPSFQLLINTKTQLSG